MSRYEVSPPEAYVQAGQPSGRLSMHRSGICRAGCETLARAYSDAGARELGITGVCEPCFDYMTWPIDEPAPTWMKLVKHSNKENA